MSNKSGGATWTYESGRDADAASQMVKYNHILPVILDAFEAVVKVECYVWLLEICVAG